MFGMNFQNSVTRPPLSQGGGPGGIRAHEYRGFCLVGQTSLTENETTYNARRVACSLPDTDFPEFIHIS